MVTAANFRRPLLICLGGGGGQIAEHLFNSGRYSALLRQVDMVYANTDAQALSRASVTRKLQLGKLGLGAGGKSQVGRRAAEEGRAELEGEMLHRRVVLLAAGLGGGTGSGASPYVAGVARSMGARVAFIGTMPFSFEGGRRESNAREALDELSSICDATFALPNEMLLDAFGDDVTQDEAFNGANEAICFAIQRAVAPAESSQDLRSLLVTSNPRANWANLLALYEDWERQAARLFDHPAVESGSSIITLRTQSELLQLARDPSRIHTISPRRFEELMHALYRAAGLRVELTKQARDDGVDLLVWTPGSLFGSDFLTVVQLKRYTGRTKVGSPAIRELKGTQSLFDASRAECVTTTGFTKSARETAAKLSIDLAEFAQLCAKIEFTVRVK